MMVGNALLNRWWEKGAREKGKEDKLKEKGKRSCEN